MYEYSSTVVPKLTSTRAARVADPVIFSNYVITGTVLWVVAVVTRNTSARAASC